MSDDGCLMMDDEIRSFKIFPPQFLWRIFLLGALNAKAQKKSFNGSVFKAQRF